MDLARSALVLRHMLRFFVIVRLATLASIVTASIVAPACASIDLCFASPRGWRMREACTRVNMCGNRMSRPRNRARPVSLSEQRLCLS